MNPLSPSNIMLKLNDDRIDLLSKIKQYSGCLGSNERVQLEQLKTQYNKLMNHVDEYNISPLSDPLQALPIEIWEDIIVNLLESSVGGWPIKWGINEILPLSFVSISWQHNILSTPRFWTRIQIHDKEIDLEAKLAMCIYLSKNLPLYIHTGCSMLQWDTIGHILIPQSFRIRSLFLSGASQLPLMNVVKSFGRLPILEDLSIPGLSDPRPNLDFLFKDTIKMRSINGVYGSSEIFQSKSMQRLQYLSVHKPHSELLPYLRNLHYLKVVRFYGDETIYDDTEEGISRIEQEDDTLGQTQEPRGWTSLKTFHHPRNSAWPLLDSVSSSLHTLNIKISCESLTKLMLACSHMAHLFHVRLNLTISMQSHFRADSVNGHGSGIQSLSIRILWFYPDLEDLEDAEAGKMTRQRLTKRICEALILWAPDVKRFILSGLFSTYFILPYIRSLKKLTCLSMKSFIENDEALLELLSLETLTIAGKGSNSTLSVLSCPNILSLHIRGTTTPLEDATIQLLPLRASRWRSLRSLEVLNNTTTWESISLPMVDTITIGSTGLSGYLSPSLIKELACHPTAFPSLTCIQMRYFPDWDILFIMLERRNLSTSKGAVAITKLKLPSFPGLIILQPLVGLLHRRLIARPSNFEISLQGLAKSYFDSNLNGCRACHKSFQPCIQQAMFRYQPPGSDGKVLQIPPYPLDEDELLATCLERADWWNHTTQTIFEREYPCSRHGIAEITGYTCSGLFDPLKPVNQSVSALMVQGLVNSTS